MRVLYFYKIFRLLRHQFATGKFDFSEPVPEEGASRYQATTEIRRKIRVWREKELSAGEVVQLLSEDEADRSVRTVERGLSEEGFSRLPRRTRLKIGLTVKEAEVPERSEGVSHAQMERRHFSCESADTVLSVPFLGKFQVAKLVRFAGLPGSKIIPTVSYFHSFPAQRLSVFEQCDVQKIFRHFVRGEADVVVTTGEVQVTYDRRAHNTILRDVPWQIMPRTIS